MLSPLSLSLQVPSHKRSSTYYTFESYVWTTMSWLVRLCASCSWSEWKRIFIWLVPQTHLSVRIRGKIFRFSSLLDDRPWRPESCWADRVSYLLWYRAVPYFSMVLNGTSPANSGYIEIIALGNRQGHHMYLVEAKLSASTTQYGDCFPSETCVTFRPYSSIVGTSLGPGNAKSFGQQAIRWRARNRCIFFVFPSAFVRSALVIVYSNENLVIYQSTLLTKVWQIVYTASMEI